MSQPNWIKSAWGWASAIPHNFTAPASRGLPASKFTGTLPFPDVDSNHWASDYIQTLANLQIISGFPDGSFRPDAPVTRAQFAAILRNAFPTDLDLRNVKPFSDVAPSYWATSAISTTRATGFLSGYPGNRFRPEQNIPRVQALVALANGLNYSENRLTYKEYILPSTNLDQESISTMFSFVLESAPQWFKKSQNTCPTHHLD